MKKIANNWHKSIFFGTRKDDKIKIYIRPPEFSCGWYWSFGYLGNRNEHYHLSSYAKGRNKNMYDCLLEDYDLNPAIKDKIWQFCELSQTAYALKETAEVLGRGGSHYTKNPCKDIIINEDEVKRINDIVLPSIFNELHELLTRDITSIYEQIAELYNTGMISEVIKYMVKNKVNTDALNDISGLDKRAKDIIFTAYWREFYKDKKK